MYLHTFEVLIAYETAGIQKTRTILINARNLKHIENILAKYTAKIQDNVWKITVFNSMPDLEFQQLDEELS